MTSITLHIEEQAPLAGTRETTAEGYLRANAAITRAGVVQFPGADLGLEGDTVINVLRGREAVFHPETAASAAMKPLTLRHPIEGVGSENYKDKSVGHLGNSPAESADDHLLFPVLVTEAAAIKHIAEVTDELSVGYDALFVPEGGVYEGEPYSWRVEGPMLINHVALVGQPGGGRAGGSVRILDEQTAAEKESPMAETVKVGDKDLDISALDRGNSQRCQRRRLPKLGDKPEPETPTDSAVSEELASVRTQLDESKLRNEQMAETLSKVMERNAISDLTAHINEAFPDVPGEGDEFAHLLLVLKEGSPEVYKTAEKLLKIAQEAIATGALTGEIGSTGDGKEGTVKAEIDRKSQALIEADSTLNKHTAFAKLVKSDGTLMDRYREELEG